MHEATFYIAKDGDRKNFTDILIMKSGFSTNSILNDKFQKACVDSGIELTVIGTMEMKGHCKLTEFCFTARRHNRFFRFGPRACRSLRRVIIKIPVSTSYSIWIPTYMKECNVPCLLGIDVMRKIAKVLELADEQCKVYDWEIPIVQKCRRAYI